MNINKKFTLPKKCIRRLNDCKPLSLIVASDKSFICCGLNKERNIDSDIFRHCFKNDFTDSMYDYDKKDCLSIIAVLAESMNILQQNGNE